MIALEKSNPALIFLTRCMEMDSSCSAQIKTSPQAREVTKLAKRPPTHKMAVLLLYQHVCSRIDKKEDVVVVGWWSTVVDCDSVDNETIS